MGIYLYFFIILLVIVLIHVIHMLTLDRVIEFKEVEFVSAKAAGLDGYRIALVTDVHDIGGGLEAVVERLNGMGIDLLVLGGDFSQNVDVMRRSVEVLARVKATDGIVGADGNHDDHAELFSAMAANNITVLSDSGVRVRNGLYAAGVSDLWKRHPDVAEATAQAAPGDFVLLVSHNPDVAMEQDTSSADLIVSGHTHGGQTTFFGIFAPVFLTNRISKYGHRFKGGWAKSRDGVPVYVSNGVDAGTSPFPRVFARPQVVILCITTSNK